MCEYSILSSSFIRTLLRIVTNRPFQCSILTSSHTNAIESFAYYVRCDNAAYSFNQFSDSYLIDLRGSLAADRARPIRLTLHWLRSSWNWADYVVSTKHFYAFSIGDRNTHSDRHTQTLTHNSERDNINDVKYVNSLKWSCSTCVVTRYMLPIHHCLSRNEFQQESIALVVLHVHFNYTQLRWHVTSIWKHRSPRKNASNLPINVSIRFIWTSFLWRRPPFSGLLYRLWPIVTFDQMKYTLVFNNIQKII